MIKYFWVILYQKEIIMNFSQYDEIADKYDSLFVDKLSLEENNEVGLMLESYNGSILDIGCGTGLLTDIKDVPPSIYYGIDPSKKMLDVFKSKKPLYGSHLICAPFDERILDCSQYDNIISLFGSPSYLTDEILTSIAANAKRMFLMFYRHDYNPVTYQKCCVSFEHYRRTENDLKKIFKTESIKNFNNYILIYN